MNAQEPDVNHLRDDRSKNHRTWQQNVQSLFVPTSVAIVGASENSVRGARILRNFESVGYKGTLFPVNPRYKRVAGVECYPSISELPEVPDSVLLAVAAERVPTAFREAVERGARSILVLSGGFSDHNQEGAAAQRDLGALAASHDVAFLGPNCQGTIAFADAAAQYLLPIDRDYRPGSLALISQSGSVTDALTNNQQGIGWSHIASTGNEALVSSAEILAYVIEQSSCRGVVLFLESIRRPQAFFDACDRAMELGKPVIVLKSGRTAKAQSAALAHSGALGTPDRLVDAMFAAHGVIRVESMEEALAVAAIVQSGRLPKSNKMSVMLASGGLIELLHDAGEGIELPDFQPETKEKLRECVGPWIRRENPLDYWPTDNPEKNRPLILETLTGDDNADGIIEIGQFRHTPTGGEVFSDNDYAARLMNIAARTDKFLAMVAPIFGELPSPDVVRRAGDAGVAMLSGIGVTVRALRGLTPQVRVSSPNSTNIDRPVMTEALSHETGGFSGAEALNCMQLAGLQVAGVEVVSKPQEAVAAAHRLGFPVTLKLADKELLHKTEVGGVRVGLQTADEVIDVAESMLKLGLGELIVQRTITGDMQELIVGLQTDPHFGKFVIVGMGGIWTEIFDDAVARPVGHIDTAVAHAMLESLKGYSTLTGARGRSQLNLDAVAESILIVDAIGAQFEEIKTIDLNPLMVTPEAAWVVDSLIVKG